MKFVMDERLKHRLTGLVVILSIVVIFLPAMMKTTNKRLEEKVSFSVRLPAKPTPPKVLVTQEKEVFRSVKIAKANVPSFPQDKPNRLVKAEPISLTSKMPAVIAVNKQPILAKVESIVRPALKKAAAPRKLAQAAVTGVKKEVYKVQLASFSQQSNAKILVARLRSQGYKATYNKAGTYYKVVVGQLDQRQDAVHLQKTLASKLNLNGFIIKTGVS